MANQVARSLADIRQAKRDASFRDELVTLSRSGTRAGAVLGVVAVLLYVGIHVAVMGDSLGWRQSNGVVAMWDKVIITALCVLALVLSRRVGLTGARLLVGILVVAASVASVADDITAGDTSFSPGYVTVIFLLGVVAVPYRPGQTFLLGGTLIGATYAAIEFLPAAVGVGGITHTRGHDAYLFIITVLLSGVSGLLYVNRYRQYRSRQSEKEAFERLRSVEAAKSRFFANVSHEFRTPLTLLLGPLEDTLRGWYGPIEPRLRRRIHEMLEQARGVHELINQLLEISTHDEDSVRLSVRRHDLAGFVRREAEQFRSAMERKEIDLQIETPEAPLMVWFDHEKLRRVVANLLSNALKYTPQDGIVRVRLAESESHAQLAVRDNGEGLEPDELANVFDRYATSSRTHGRQLGTGIGLALVKSIVERHGGEVTASSEPGFGAEFIVQLRLGQDHFPPEDIAYSDETSPFDPRQEIAPLEVDDELQQDAPEPSDDAPLVLVADDHAAMRTYIRDVLGADHRIVEASDGEEAWSAMQERAPNLVISDVIMPNVSGIELCERLREDERLATVPMLLVTARTGDDARVEAYGAGADAYLSKPFSGEELRVIAEQLIEIRRRLAERTQLPKWMEPKQASVPSPDAEFLERVQTVIEEHIGDSNFGVEWLADEVGISARQLQRRLKKLTRLTAAGLIKSTRLERAGVLLARGDLQVQEVADAVGYDDPNYFSQIFHHVYGVPPSEYSKEGT